MQYPITYIRNLKHFVLFYGYHKEELYDCKLLLTQETGWLCDISSDDNHEYQFVFFCTIIS